MYWIGRWWKRKKPTNALKCWWWWFMYRKLCRNVHTKCWAWQTITITFKCERESLLTSTQSIKIHDSSDKSYELVIDKSAISPLSNIKCSQLQNDTNSTQLSIYFIYSIFQSQTPDFELDCWSSCQNGERFKFAFDTNEKKSILGQRYLDISHNAKQLCQVLCDIGS